MILLSTGPDAGEVIGTLLAIIIAIIVIRAILRSVFGAVGKVGGAVVYHGARAVVGSEAAKKYERELRLAGSIVGVVGAVVAVGEAVDIGGGDVAEAPPLDAQGVSGPMLASGAVGIDLDGDGLIDGFDTDGDGLLDTNVAGVPISGLEDVDGYTRQNGTKVEPYLRTHADETTANNLQPPPHGLDRLIWLAKNAVEQIRPR